jgi:hypothetical protein
MRRSIRCGGPTRSARSRRPTGLSQRRIPRLSVGDERPLPREQLPKGWMPAARRGCSVPLATRPRPCGLRLHAWADPARAQRPATSRRAN